MLSEILIIEIEPFVEEVIICMHPKR